MSNCRTKNNGLTYLRRSGNRQEMSLGQQLEWALQVAAEHDIEFAAVPDDLEHMRRHRLHSYKGIRLDDAITGANLERPGFLAFIDDLLKDSSYSHGFILRRDRFARPDEASEMVLREKRLAQAGVTLVFHDKVLEPLEYGQTDFGRDLLAFYEYYSSGEYLWKLAENVIPAHRALADDGFSTGGRPPYGFVRALCDSEGEILEYLPDGKTVRQPGCHVRWVPGPTEEHEARIKVWLMILDLKLRGWGSKRIAAHLNELGIPSPAAGSVRTDHGVPHRVSGRWSPNAVAELCRNKAILGIKTHGRRSEGKHRRLAAVGDRHRFLTSQDLNEKEKPKAVMNPPSVVAEAPSGSPGHYDTAKWEQIQMETQRRGDSQRGIPRAKDPAKYPLSCRVVDMTDDCGSIMYGAVQSGRRLYKCGRYMRTAGAECNNNAVDAEATLRFVLRTLEQLAGGPANRQELKDLLWQHAQLEAESGVDDHQETAVAGLKARMAELEELIPVIQHRMGRERDERVYAALRTEFTEIESEKSDLEERIRDLGDRQNSKQPRTPADEVDAALALFDEIVRVVTDDEARAEIPQMIRRLGIWVGLRFCEGLKGKKRVVRRLHSGVIAFGDAELPVKLHGRNRALEDDSAPLPDALDGYNSTRLERTTTVEGGAVPPSTDSRQSQCHREGISFTKVNRDDWI